MTYTCGCGKPLDWSRPCADCQRWIAAQIASLEADPRYDARGYTDAERRDRDRGRLPLLEGA